MKREDLTIPEDLYRRLESYAARLGVPVADILELIIETKLDAADYMQAQIRRRRVS